MSFHNSEWEFMRLWITSCTSSADTLLLGLNFLEVFPLDNSSIVVVEEFGELIERR